jgi:hypothetical protein
MTSVNAQHEALLDELLKDYTDPKDILGEHGLLKQLTKRVVERVLEAELTAHLGYAPYGRYGTGAQSAYALLPFQWLRVSPLGLSSWRVWRHLMQEAEATRRARDPSTMSARAPHTATTPMPVPLSEPACTALLFTHLSMPQGVPIFPKKLLLGRVCSVVGSLIVTPLA